jgi:hypothetical protein
MNTYIHTEESAKQTIKNYRNLNGYSDYDEVIESMEHCYDELDDEERSALGMIRSRPHLLQELKDEPKITGYSLLIHWSDGTKEERIDFPEIEFIEDYLNDIERGS